MTPVTLNSPIQEIYTPAPSQKPAATTFGQPVDAVQLSPAALREVALTGRVALNDAGGNLTSDQSQQLYGQISTIQTQIAADLQAGGGTLSSTDAQAIQQSQNELSGTIYSDAHNGAAPPSDPNVPQASQREALQAGRIVLNEKAGNLTSGQAQQLGSQVNTIQQQIASDEQANGGTLSSTDAQAINQLQTQLSQQIYQATHPAVGPEPVVNPA